MSQLLTVTLKRLHSSSNRSLLIAFVPVLILLVLPVSAKAQTTSPTDGTTPLGLSPGSPSGSFSLSGFESVNPYNGNLNFHLPLVGAGGRGGAGASSLLGIDSKGWTVRHQETTDPYGNPVDIYTPVANPWVPKPGYGPGILVGRQSGISPTQSCGIHRYIYQQTLTRLTFTAADGTEYEFRDQLTGGQPATVGNPCGSGSSRGTTFITADGSAATFISDTTINDKMDSSGSSMIYPSGYLMLRDGSKYRIDSGGLTWMRDRNGNKMSFAYGTGGVTTITDSLNRQITITYADYSTTFYDQITLKGFGGASRTIRVNYTTLSNALRTTNPRNEPASRYQIQTYHALFPELNNASSYSTWNPWVVSSVTLPNNQQYQFYYNCFAELARVNLPTSGAIEYDYTAGSGVVTDYTDFHVYRRVKERRVYPDGTNLESYTTYGESGNPITVDQLSASGTLLAREKHYFYGDPVNSLFTATGISYPARLDGREYQTDAYASDGTTLLRHEQTTWANRAPVSWWWNPGDASEPPNDPRVTDTTGTLADVSPNLISKHTFGYDDSVPYNNRNDVKEYGFGNGSPGALTRETTTTYITSSTYTGTSVHLRSLPLQSSVFDAGGIERARTTYEYDNYATNTNHAALTNRSNISGFDSSFNTSYTTRGNATSSTNYLLNSSGQVTGSISGYAQYDIAGNVIKAIDARGYATTFDFTDRYGAPDGDARANTAPTELSSQSQYSYAFATAVTNALGHTAYLQFDYYLGRPVDAEDANGTTYSGYSDNDSLDRPTKVVRAVNNSSIKSQSTFAYNDSARTVTVTSDQTTYGDNLLKGVSVYDGLGRTIETRAYENSTQYIAVQHVPFAVLQDPDSGAWVRAAQSSNPFRPYLSETPVWSTSFSDALGRATKVRTPDNAIARTSYSGNTVTVSDQTGKARKSESDALGRLTKVYEDPNGANWQTSYSYDVLNDLLTVSQGSQTRTFVYDSLKRLTSATNPENGTVSYSYDNNGNLLTRLDARNITTTIAYDALNRPTSKSYNDNPQTATVNYFYDAQTLPSGAPTFSRGSSTGRLVAVTYGGASAGDYFGYDALGRDVLKIQQTGGVNYRTSAVYNIAGALTSETYPSGRTVSYGFDQAGRTSSVTGTLGDGTSRNYSTGITYSSLGGLSQEQFGTDTAVFNKLFYNARGQLAEIRESTTGGDTSWNRGAIINQYSNNCWGMCGGSNSTTAMTDNNGSLKRQDTYIPDNDQVSSYKTWADAYTYDNLNRLTQVSEDTGNQSFNWQQAFTLDAYGNRTIDYNNTSASIPRPQFNVDTSTNRLAVPNGYSGTMQYDNAGNLTNDTYTGQGSRNYDAENRMTKAWANNQWQIYTYDGSGKRVRRNINNQETWQVYGIGGALVAEYDAGAGATAAPLKEYGYRNGQLLVTASAVDLALGKTATQSSTFSGMAASRAVDGNTDGAIWDGYASVTNYESNAWWQVDLGSVQSIGAVQVWGRTDCCPEMTSNFYVFVSDNPFTSTDLNTTLNQAGVSNYYVSGFSGTPGTINVNRTGRYVRVQFAAAQYLVLGEVKVLSPTADLRWLVGDQLGTPRMIFDKSGSLAAMTRHDYLPFGEELMASTGLRTTTQGYTAAGYSASDKARHKFTEQERDDETGMDYMHARYHSSSQGRFTSPDSLLGSLSNPESLNRYSYVGNDPINLSDPTGHMPSYHQYSSWRQDGDDQSYSWSWDDPTSPQAVLRQLGILPSEIVGHQLNDFPVAAEEPDS